MDAITAPAHYTSHPSGVECKDIMGWHPAFVGAAIKYLWRAGLKVTEGERSLDAEIRDLSKARQFITFEIERLETIKAKGG